MSRKTNTDFSTSSWDFLGKELNSYLKEIRQELVEEREAALNEASEYLQGEFEKNTPIDTSKTKESWQREDKYSGVRYIFNTATSKDKGGIVPRLNIIEFSTKHGKPFVRRTFDNSREKIEQIILKNLKKEN